MKLKIIVIGIIMVLMGTSLCTVEAATQQEKVTLELVTVNLGGLLSKQKLELTENELEDLKEILSNLIEKLQTAKDDQPINDALNKLQRKRHPVRSVISKLLLNIWQSRGKSFVVSYGKGYKLNPLKTRSFKLHKRIALWHYSSGQVLDGKTLILNLRELKTRVLSGTQLGIMTGFRGIYLYSPNKIPEKSFTFFMGRAKHVGGFQLPKIQLPNIDLPEFELPNFQLSEFGNKSAQ